MTREDLASRLDMTMAAEHAINRVAAGDNPDWIAVRWWALKPLILVGGSIQDAADGTHLQTAYGIRSVVSVESERKDDGKIAVPAIWIPFEDNGQPRLLSYVETLRFLKLAGKFPTYIHCQMGGSRSPSVAYAVLRKHFGATAEQALATIKSFFKGNWGDHHYHKAYIQMAEQALGVE